MGTGTAHEAHTPSLLCRFIAGELACSRDRFEPFDPARATAETEGVWAKFAVWAAWAAWARCSCSAGFDVDELVMVLGTPSLRGCWLCSCSCSCAGGGKCAWLAGGLVRGLLHTKDGKGE